MTASGELAIEQRTTSKDYLDPQLLATVAGVDLRARMVVEGLMQGMHRSPMQGISVEFAQHRAYAPGDDTRFLDWKVFGRTDKLYLKQYQKETNLDLLVMVDVSGSMAYGSAARSKSPGMAMPGLWRKFDHAACLAAAMAYLAVQQQDRVALSLFDTELRQATRISNRQGHWRTIVEALAGHEDISVSEDQPVRTALAGVFEAAAAQLTQRSLIVLISDLFDDPALIERGLARLHHRRHDVILMQVMDPAELDFPFRSPSQFVGLEAEGRVQLDPAALREGYLESVQRHLDAIEAITRKFRFDHLLVNSRDPLGPLLSHYLARRASRVAKG